ncbi:MAG: TldD/PmbA family protein [Firmicutes bacterium]|nr:TldD/PmbA family protein [Bacillota bacterium]MCL2256356.1 TldD/PmbA family protein [Bacillota bacterium]
MKLKYPKGFYVDVRIENVFSTQIRYTTRELNECKTREYIAAFIRVFDGKKWFYASTTEIDGIQKEIDSLATLATPNKDIEKNTIVKRMSKAVDAVYSYEKSKVTDISLEKKLEFLEPLHSFVTDSTIKMYVLIYSDTHKVKEFHNSLGACIKQDFQLSGFAIGVEMSEGEKKFSGRFMRTKPHFEELVDFEDELKADLVSFKEFMLQSEPVEAGIYPLVFSPQVTGIFTHEIFGHKSEADAMMGDEATKAEWVIGKTMGMSELNIIDEGTSLNSGFVPYDDEGNKARINYLIKGGKLSGRLHSVTTAADFDDEVTGNARAISYEFEPIVRMTNTYIDNGSKSVDELIAPIKKGFYIKSVSHGSGLSTFTIAPDRAYMIENGKITKPVRISVVTGSVFETLGDIDGIANDLQIQTSIFGGCGKGVQFPCPVSFGGPSIRVSKMTVQ